jgi:hypothetical protein
VKNWKEIGEEKLEIMEKIKDCGLILHVGDVASEETAEKLRSLREVVDPRCLTSKRTNLVRLGGAYMEQNDVRHNGTLLQADMYSLEMIFW